MAQVFFHCSNAEEIWVDGRGVAVGNFAEAHQQAATVVRSLLMTAGTVRLPARQAALRGRHVSPTSQCDHDKVAPAD
jgi:hypothetical protein